MIRNNSLKHETIALRPSITKFFHALPPKKKALALKVRDIVLKSDPTITEDIKWGNLTFVSNSSFAFIYSYDTVDYINFAFFKATQLSDPKGLFEGTGKSMRHIKIYAEKDISKKQIVAWVREAVKLNQKHSKK